MLQVIKLISQVIADFANGEISQVSTVIVHCVQQLDRSVNVYPLQMDMIQTKFCICLMISFTLQASSLFDTEVTLEQYIDKSFYKTASLIAASCRSAAVFSDAPVEMKEAMYNYGKHLGLAFQASGVPVVSCTQGIVVAPLPVNGECMALLQCCCRWWMTSWTSHSQQSSWASHRLVLTCSAQLTAHYCSWRCCGAEFR
jgi:hypothetical protein